MSMEFHGKEGGYTRPDNTVRRRSYIQASMIKGFSATLDISTEELLPFKFSIKLQLPV